ncbi:MAG: glycogen/starch synthase, partial [Muribaculaceae bacterium]|nr:glycogen/starch synthase [Muribaculaceae bacterium]
VMHCSGWITALSPMYIKKAYSDDPTIGPSKIVYSIFDDTFDGTLDPRFVEKLKMDGFTDDDIAPLGNDPVNCIALNKLAIKYADGIIQASPEVPAELIDYAKSLGKPFLPYTGEEIDAPGVVEFYQNL